MRIWDYITGKNHVPRILPCGAILVDTTNAGLYDGRQFRLCHEFNLADGAKICLKVDSPVDFILRQQCIDLTDGEIRFEASQGNTESTAFTVNTNVFGKNRSDYMVKPAYVRQLSVKSGGTIAADGSVSETIVLKTSGVSQKSMTVGSSANDVRFLPKGVYYLLFQATGVTRGIYNLTWEEFEPSFVYGR